MDPPICRADSLAVPERLAGVCRSSDTSKQDSEAAAHAPGTPKLLITASDEH